MAHRRRMLIRDAAEEAREEQSWACQSCHSMIEESRDGERYCWYCGEYWKDVEAGVFDEFDA